MRSLIRKGLGSRFLRFASIGLLCLVLIQIPSMLVLMEVGVNALIANATGFMLSGVINYEAQRRLTFDGQVKGSWVKGLFKFQITSLFSLGVNTLVYAATFYGVGMLIPEVTALRGSFGLSWLDPLAMTAAFIGAVSGTGCNFIASRIFTYGHSDRHAEGEARVLNDEPAETERQPTLSEVRAAVAGDTLAVFMPAYKEGENLPNTVPALHAYLSTLGLVDFRIIIVNDGSPDNTGEVAEALAARYDEVEVVHHPVNRGYGGALITGFQWVVSSGMRLWAFCDSDGQFDPRSFGTLLVALFTPELEKAADMAAGYRLGRRNSDSAWRFWLGRAWHFFGRFVVGRNADGEFLLSVHDVDCGLKAGYTKSLARIVNQLQGQAAAISPELIARTMLDRQTIVECGVTHLPRLAGTSTGDNPKVMLRSALQIIKLGIRFRTMRYFGWRHNAAGDALLTLSMEEA